MTVAQQTFRDVCPFLCRDGAVYFKLWYGTPRCHVDKVWGDYHVVPTSDVAPLGVMKSATPVCHDRIRLLPHSIR